MKHSISIVVLIAVASIAAFHVMAESLYDVIEEAQKTINAKYPDESSIARKMATEELEKIARSDKSKEERIAAIREKYPAVPVQSETKETGRNYELKKEPEQLEQLSEKDIKALHEAAEQGHAASQYNLGMRYYEGEGVKQSYPESFKWFRKSAEQGNVEAQFMLGQSYEYGKGVDDDKTEAIKWYRKAAKQGHALAQFCLETQGMKWENISDNEEGKIEGQIDAETLFKLGSIGEKLSDKLLNNDITIYLSDNVKIEMVRVEAGSFTMSINDRENLPTEISHNVTLTRDFYIGQTEVTQSQWQAVMGRNPSSSKGADLPVERVSWNDAMSFCEKLNTMEKVPSGWKFTLPTETQWEYAARGGKKSKGYIYSGSNSIYDVAWYNTTKTHPVRQKKANELGLYDMSGNVHEWCLDDWNSDSSKQVAEFSRGNERGGSMRVRRGGSWPELARSCRSGRRSCDEPDSKDGINGFRLALVQIK